MDVKGYELCQALTATTGGLLGLQPLITRLFNGHQGGLYGLVFEQFHFQDPMTYVVPIAVVVLALAVIIGLDVLKKRV